MAFYQIPSEAITSVTFGLKASRERTDTVKTIIRGTESYNHINLYQAKMCNENYNLRIEPIDA